MFMLRNTADSHSFQVRTLLFEGPNYSFSPDGSVVTVSNAGGSRLLHLAGGILAGAWDGSVPLRPCGAIRVISPESSCLGGGSQSLYAENDQLGLTYTAIDLGDERVRISPTPHLVWQAGRYAIFGTTFSRTVSGSPSSAPSSVSFWTDPFGAAITPATYPLPASFVSGGAIGSNPCESVSNFASQTDLLISGGLDNANWGLFEPCPYTPLANPHVANFFGSTGRRWLNPDGYFTNGPKKAADVAVGQNLNGFMDWLHDYTQSYGSTDYYECTFAYEEAFQIIRACVRSGYSLRQFYGVAGISLKVGFGAAGELGSGAAAQRGTHFLLGMTAGPAPGDAGFFGTYNWPPGYPTCDGNLDPSSAQTVTLGWGWETLRPSDPSTVHQSAYAQILEGTANVLGTFSTDQLPGWNTTIDLSSLVDELAPTANGNEMQRLWFGLWPSDHLGFAGQNPTIVLPSGPDYRTRYWLGDAPARMGYLRATVTLGP